MNKTIKKKLLTIAACAVSTAVCFGALVACNGDDTKPETPVHHAAVAADCVTAGNIEYWTKGGKYYSDEACKTEIAQTATVVNALGHDYTDAAYVNTDADKHWQVCKRTGCDVTNTKVDHTYTNGTCVCGKVEPFDTSIFDLWQFTENGANLGATCNKDNGAVTVTATAPDNEAWHIKLSNDLDNITLGHYYEVTYAIHSNVAGKLWFESQDGAYIKRDFDLKEGDNTVKFGFWAGKVTDGKTNAVLQLGVMPANFEIKVTSFKYEEKANLGNFMQGWKLDTNSAATATQQATTDGTIKVTATGSGEGWHLKLAKDVTLVSGHKYELTMVYVVSGRKNGNLKYVVYDGKAAVENDGLCWMDHDGVYDKTYKFTANESCTIGSCLEYGDITNAENPITLTVAYINLTDVTPAA